MERVIAMIADAHTHVFPALRGTGRRGPITGLGHGWVSVGGTRAKLMPDLVGADSRFTSDQLLGLMDKAGVRQTMLLQGPFYGECNAFALAAVKGHPDRLVVAAYFDPWQTDWRETFRAMMNESGFLGIKIEFSEETGLSGIHPGSRLDEPRLNELWSEMERTGRVLTLDLGAVGSASYQTDAVAGIARRHPELPIVICHLAQPGPALRSDDDRITLWRKQIELGRFPNVFFDTASLPVYFRAQRHPFDGCREFLRRAADAIGPGKILWGSDAPGTLTLVSYDGYVELTKRHLDFLSDGEQAQVLGGNARHVYFAERGG